MPNARSIIKDNKNVEFTDSADAALNGADVLAVITEWLEFRSPTLKIWRESSKPRQFLMAAICTIPRQCGQRVSILWYRARIVTQRASTLVTGVAGFIGSFVAQRLLERGAQS